VFGNLRGRDRSRAVQFDLRSIDPPGLDLAWVLLVCVVLASGIGVLWAGVTRLRGASSAADQRVWLWAFLAGVLVSALVPTMLYRAEEPGYYVVLFVLWLLVSVFGAGVFLSRGSSLERRRVGHRVFQGTAMFCFGAVVPAWVGAIINAMRD
jgi:cell division protein FtsW (lipid II flippase)